MSELGALRAALVRYVAFPDEASADAVTLWIAASHVQPAWEHAPRLVITAPEKRCGKSRLLDIVEATCHDPLITVNASVAAVVRSIGDDPPTLLVDEADTIFGPKVRGDNEDLRGILNAGHQRNRPSIRYNVTINDVEKLNTFAMAALAGIGDLPDTIMDRAIVIRMRRRAAGETVSPYRTRRDRPALTALAKTIHQWVRGAEHVLQAATPEMPVEDRAADTWEPLVAVADLAGAEWSKRARAAAETFTSVADAADTDASLSMRLLADIRDIFGRNPQGEFMGSTTLTTLLNEIEDAPWKSYGRDGLTVRALANKLRPYGIKTGHNTNRDTRGYRFAEFADAFARYLASPTVQATETGVLAGHRPDTTPDTGISPIRPDASDSPARPAIRPDVDQEKQSDSDAWTVPDDQQTFTKPCGWWLRSGGQHGNGCHGCRTSPGGPDHVKEPSR